MRQADAFDPTFHHRNLAKILDRAMRLAKMAGQESDLHPARPASARNAVLASSTALAPMAEPYIEGLIMSMTNTIILTWAFGLAALGKTVPLDTALSKVPLWHSLFGAVAAWLFFIACFSR
jgi:hypothetical protein